MSAISSGEPVLPSYERQSPTAPLNARVIVRFGEHGLEVQPIKRVAAC